ncbi:phage holin family protein [Kribbella sp. NPDC051620]|uniref:phage holin family protein n=1 Tax=Kribbella sp. NPDC051620 TaxID=3364120 RepID=UPI0037B3C56B
MTVSGSSPNGGARPASVDESVGELVSQLTTDLGDLTRKELALAKAELQAEAKKAGKGAGMLGGAAVAGWMVALFVSFTIMWALDEAMDLIWAALIVAALWAVVAAVLATRGRRELQEVSPKPDQTVESLKEDAQWLKPRKS